MTVMTYIAAIGLAQREAMRADERVIIFGEDVEANVYRNTPIAEEAMVGTAIGAAMTGLRPIVDLSYSNFLYMAMDQFVNQAAKNRYMFGGQSSVPVVFRSAMFYSLNTAAHHSDRPYPMFMNVPGLKVVVPASPSDAKGLLRTAVDSNDPVLIFEAVPLWGLKEEVDESEYRIPFGQARLRREGHDVTVVAISGCVPLALAAAEQMATQRGISAEVIDPRTLVPLDTKTILDSVRRTGRLIITEPAHRTCGAAAEIAAVVAEQAYESLRAPVLRVTSPDMQVPFSPVLEAELYPTTDKIAAAIARVCSNKPFASDGVTQGAVL